MKRMLSLILAMSLLLLAGCGGNSAGETTVPTTAAPTETTEATEAPTTEAMTEPTAAPTTEPETKPTEPAEARNPLTGELLDAPLESRIFAITINNIPAALPHYGVSKADLYFEMFVNDYATRGLALYADVTEADAIGSVRSLRYNFTDICQAYDAVVVHASGSDEVLKDLKSSGVPNVSVESEVADYYFRDKGRQNDGYAWEHTLFVRGPELKEYAASKGISVTQDPYKDYGLHFAEDATPAGGESAAVVSIDMKHGAVTKNTTMVYDEATGLYIYNEYGYALADGWDQSPEGFTNVIVMMCDVQNQGVYHVADLLGSGDGYFACGGQLIPIQWHHDGDYEPFRFTLPDGTPLQMGIGSSYIALAPLTSTISWE